MGYVFFIVLSMLMWLISMLTMVVRRCMFLFLNVCFLFYSPLCLRCMYLFILHFRVVHACAICILYALLGDTSKPVYICGQSVDRQPQNVRMNCLLRTCI